MASLPIIKHPEYFLEVPSTKKKIKYRPFIVKEEKILLIAMQEKSPDALVNAIKQIISACTFGNVDVDSLTVFDLEYIFLQLRIKSKGRDVPLAWKCGNIINEVTCNYVNTFDFNLEEVKVFTNPDHTNKIMITETIGIIMKYPTLETALELQKAIEADSIDQIYANTIQYIDTIFEGETIYDDYSEQDFKDFLDSLPKEAFEKIRNFFKTQPRLQAKINLCCEHCGHKEVVTSEGLQSFLD